MWTKKSRIHLSNYVETRLLFKPYSATEINGISKFSKTEQTHQKWEKIGIFPEKKTFGISLAGISVEREEISIDPEKLESNVFYLFSYKDDKYVTRKTDEGIIEVYEVVE